MTTPRGRKRELNYRKEEVSYVMQRWRASESCSLIGVGSVGKSNLLQHLVDPEVQQAYMNITKTGQFRAIIIDPNLLGPLTLDGTDKDQKSSWAGYELMMHRLFMAFYPFTDTIGHEEGARFYQLYQQLQNGNNPLYAYMGLRYFELALDILMRQGIRVVFMFDEFEEMLKKLPEKFFQTLRGLRDTNKRYLSYLTFTRAPLNILVEQFGKDTLEMEPFTELFTDNILYVGPYNEVDARKMINELIAGNDKHYAEAHVDFLMNTTGSYAGLIRSGFRVLDSLGTIDRTSTMDDSLIHQFASRRPVRMECKTIWLSLTPPEHHVLRAVGGLENYNANSETEEAMTMLIQKRLLFIDRINNNLHIQPPVFKAFIATNPDSETFD